MTRVPVIPTVLVTLAVTAMVALGFWQLLDRLPQKEAFLAQLAANPAKAPIAFPTTPDDTLLFRRTVATCPPPVTTKLAGAGASGYRVIARCASGIQVQLGTTRNPNARTAWNGGPVAGYISHAPSALSLIGSLFDHTPQQMLLVADTPPPGLAPNARPDIGSVPNNHLAYAGQWFFFAAVAAIIYTLALRRRGVVPAPRAR